MPEALDPALSWAGVPGASVGGIWPSVSGGARAWWLAEQLVARLSLAAESAPSWSDSKWIQSWSTWAESVSLPGMTSVWL